MAVRIERTRANARLSAHECALITARLAVSGQVTLLAPSKRARDAFRRQLAEAGISVGVEVSTPVEWICGLWELCGDGTRPISPLEREFAIARVFSERDASDLAPLSNSPGTVRLVARMARDLLPYVLEDDGGASDALARVRLLLSDYARALDATGLIELACAAERLRPSLAERPLARTRSIVVRDITELPAYLVRLLASIAVRADVRLLLDGEQEALIGDVSAALAACDPAPEITVEHVPAAAADVSSQAGAPSFIEVSGPHARAGAYARAITGLIDAGRGQTGRVAVVAARPAALFDVLAERLAVAGVASSATRVAGFAETTVGTQLAALSDLGARMDAARRGCASAREWWPAPELSDWLCSPLSGASALEARRFDKRIRSNRALGPEEVDRELQSIQGRLRASRSRLPHRSAWSGVSVICADAVRLIAQGRLIAALRAMSEVASALPPNAMGSANGRACALLEQTAAARAADALESAGGALGVSQTVAATALGGLFTVVPLAGGPSDGATSSGEAVFLTPEEAALLPPGSFDGVLLADVDQESFPFAREEGALISLAERLGRSAVALEPAARLRDLLGRALALSERAVLARVTHDGQADDRYPAAFWIELAARCGSSATVCKIGEGDIVGDLDPAAGALMRSEQVACTDPQHLGERALPWLVLQQRAGADAPAPFEPRRLSASQIETYACCPLCWFISQRVRPQRIDAGFTNMEKGNFVHDVMDRFHERLIEEGLARVRADNLDRSLALLAEVFGRVRADHARNKTSGSGALVAHSKIEELEIDDLRAQLADVARFEAGVLAPFAPRWLEYSFDALGVSYAGWPFGGRIDRVDVDAHGRAVVIDYKHRGDASQFALSDPTAPNRAGVVADDDPRWLPEHTQTLIYAQAIRRALGLDVRAALYLATKGAPQLRGAASDELCEQEPGDGRIPGLRKGFPGAGGTMTFEELLDRVEAGVGLRLDELRDGEIEAVPTPRSSCGYNHPFGFTRRDA